MTLTELRYIVAVADERHFGHAAARCFISQPSLSASVKKLEEELGVTIFERNQHGVLVTPDGQELVEQARKVLAEAERMRQIAQQRSHPLRGPLRLGILPTVAPYLLPDLVAGLRRSAPDMPLQIEENLTAVLDQMLQSGEIDAAILALPYDGAGIDVTPLFDEDFLVVVPARHPLARRRSVGSDALEERELLVLPIGHCFRDQVMGACGRFSRAPAPGRQGNSLETLRSMVASGLGITVLPATALTERHVSPLLRAIPFIDPPPQRRIVLAARSGFPRRGALDALAQAVRALPLPITPIPNDRGTAAGPAIARGARRGARRNDPPLAEKAAPQHDRAT